MSDGTKTLRFEFKDDHKTPVQPEQIAAQMLRQLKSEAAETEKREEKKGHGALIETHIKAVHSIEKPAQTAEQAHHAVNAAVHLNMTFKRLSGSEKEEESRGKDKKSDAVKKGDSPNAPESEAQAKTADTAKDQDNSFSDAMENAEEDATSDNAPNVRHLTPDVALPGLRAAIPAAMQSPAAQFVTSAVETAENLFGTAIAPFLAAPAIHYSVQDAAPGNLQSPPSLETLQAPVAETSLSAPDMNSFVPLESGHFVAPAAPALSSFSTPAIDFPVSLPGTGDLSLSAAGGDSPMFVDARGMLMEQFQMNAGMSEIPTMANFPQFAAPAMAGPAFAAPKMAPPMPNFNDPAFGGSGLSGMSVDSSGDLALSALSSMVGV